MRLLAESPENAAAVLAFIEGQLDRRLPFLPNLDFLAAAWKGEEKMVVARVCTARDDAGEIVGCAVRLLWPNPAFAGDDEVVAAQAEAMKMNPQLGWGVVQRMLDVGTAAGLAEFADAVAGSEIQAA